MKLAIHLESINRRKFIRTSAMASLGIGLFPHIPCNGVRVEKPMTRTFGRIGKEISTLGLGGQASLQWTPEDVDPVAIILKAIMLGLTCFDTSNAYGPSQSYYEEAFRSAPGQPLKVNFN